MAYVDSTYKDPSKTFVWWIEGDRLAIATTDGDGDTRETCESKLKAVQIGSSNDQNIAGLPLGMTICTSNITWICGVVK